MPLLQPFSCPASDNNNATNCFDAEHDQSTQELLHNYSNIVLLTQFADLAPLVNLRTLAQNFHDYALFSLQERSYTIVDTQIDGISIPSFNSNGEPRLMLPQFIVAIQDKGITISKLKETCDMLKIHCVQANEIELQMAKWASFIEANVISLGLIFKSDAERLYKQLFVKHSLTASDSRNIANCIYLYHNCFGKERGAFFPDLYTDENACCVECCNCKGMLSPKSFVGHTHQSKETSIRHWGFDSQNWRAYLTLDRQKYSSLNAAELAVVTHRYENVKSKFQAPTHAAHTQPHLIPSLSTTTLDLLSNVHNSASNCHFVCENDGQNLLNVASEPLVEKFFKPSSNDKDDVDSVEKQSLVKNISILEQDVLEEFCLIQRLMLQNKCVCDDEAQHHCSLKNLSLVKSQYMNYLDQLKNDFNKINVMQKLDDLAWQKKVNRLKSKKRALKRALSDNTEPHRKQFIQLRYQLELQEERNRELDDLIGHLRAKSHQREQEFQSILNRKIEEVDLAKVEADKLRSQLHRVQRLQHTDFASSDTKDFHTNLFIDDTKIRNSTC